MVFICIIILYYIYQSSQYLFVKWVLFSLKLKVVHLSLACCLSYKVIHYPYSYVTSFWHLVINPALAQHVSYMQHTNCHFITKGLYNITYFSIIYSDKSLYSYTKCNFPGRFDMWEMSVSWFFHDLLFIWHDMLYLG